jgi:hypothetical protein
MSFWFFKVDFLMVSLGVWTSTVSRLLDGFFQDVWTSMVFSRTCSVGCFRDLDLNLVFLG